MQAGEGIALVARAGEDIERRELMLLLVLARSDQQTIDAIEADPSLQDSDRRALARLLPAERRARRKGEASPGRRALAERLIAMGEPTEADLRQILDEASFEEIPRALCAPWLRFHARRLAREVLGEASQIAAPAPGERPDEAVVSALDGWLAQLVEAPSAPPPPEILALPPAERIAPLEVSLARAQGSRLRKLGRALAQIEDPALAVPVFCAAQRVSDYRARRSLGAGIGRSPLLPHWTVLSWDPSDPSAAAFAIEQPSTVLAAFLCAELWRAPLRDAQRETIWRLLAGLGEPVALAERIRYGVGADPMTGLSGYFGPDSMPDHPRAVEALLRIVLRRDERLEVLQSKTREEWDDSRSNTGIWRGAADVLPEVIASRPLPPSTRRLLAEKLRRDQASGEPREDLYRLALSLARIGDPSGLYLLLEQLQLEERPSRSLIFALRALGPAAREASPLLKAKADSPWSLIGLAALEPEQHEWADRLLAAIADPSVRFHFEARIEQYIEGLVTKGEVDAVLGHYVESAKLLRERDAPALYRAAAHLAPVIEAHAATLPELCVLTRP